VKHALVGQNWSSLEDVCVLAVSNNWAGVSETQIYELVEQNLPYVAEHLRDDASECTMDGAAPSFEIDNEQLPYIRALSSSGRDLLVKLRTIDPSSVEKICAEVLVKLGAEAQATQQTHDGGVDFLGLHLRIVSSEFGVPVACRAAVIGQTKRYKETNAIKETMLREFVGAATLRRHELQREGKIGPLAPVLYAFWTTSSFDPNAKRFARAIGLWYMDGLTLANYVDGLGLRNSVMSQPDGAAIRSC